jgi:hypothetical protein
MPDIFDIDYEVQEQNILPPTKRLPVILAYMFAIIYALQWVRDRILGDYKAGATYPIYNAFATYNIGDRVIFFEDHSVYECMVNGTVSGIGGPASDPAWMKIQDLFIGVDERIKYNSQIIVLEYALNRYYLVPPTDPQIYIENNSSATPFFVMGNTGQTSSNMVNDSSISVAITAWMGNVPTFPTPAPPFTVFVPTSLFATLGLTVQDQENNIRQFVDKYKLGGLTYSVEQF